MTGEKIDVAIREHLENNIFRVTSAMRESPNMDDRDICVKAAKPVIVMWTRADWPLGMRGWIRRTPYSDVTVHRRCMCVLDAVYIT